MRQLVFRSELSLVKGLYPLLRSYSTAKDLTPPKHAIEQAEEIFSEFEKHPARHNDLFKYLAEASTVGISPEQYELIRDNYLRRTKKTIVSVASHIDKAIENGDFDAIAMVGQNFADESGRGDPSAVHLRLLEECYNRHGKTVFGLNPMKIKDVNESPLILRKTRDFGNIQQALFEGSYARMTGCLLAHEGAADEMLENFRKYLFNPYKGYYTEQDFKDLVRYFDAHHDDSKEMGNVEQQHQQQALMIAANMIFRDEKNGKEILEGGLSFLDAQDGMWSEWHDKLQQLKEKTVIPVRDEFIVDDKPKVALSPLAKETSQMLNSRDRSQGAVSPK